MVTCGRKPCPGSGTVGHTAPMASRMVARRCSTRLDEQADSFGVGELPASVGRVAAAGLASYSSLSPSTSVRVFRVRMGRACEPEGSSRRRSRVDGSGLVDGP